MLRVGPALILRADGLRYPLVTETVLFLTDEVLFLLHLFSFGNQSVLQGLYFKNLLEILLVSRLKLAPTVNIHRFSKLILQGLNFGLLVEQILFLAADFSLEVIDAVNLGLGVSQLVLETSEGPFKFLVLFAHLVIVGFCF